LFYLICSIYGLLNEKMKKGELHKSSSRNRIGEKGRKQQQQQKEQKKIKGKGAELKKKLN